ncbi:BspA family leucine-rich repeat surface protein, partial [Enterococcus faecalis]|uniref:BspA family leucine-rich repeat surface protein n=1 Tax=Enterococcus faecalis TaxID=1351 RepID=UPI003D0F7E7A
MKISTYMLVSSLILGSLVQPVAVLAEEQKESISNDQSKIDKGASDILQAQVEKLSLKPEEKRVPFPDSSVGSEDSATISTKEELAEETSSTETDKPEENTQPSTEESTLSTPTSQTQDSSEVPSEQKEPKELPGDTTLSWGGLTLRLSTDGTLSIPGGSTTSDPEALIPADKVKNEIKKIVIENTLTVNGSAFRMFADLSNLTEIEGLDKLDTSNVTDMGAMFYNCRGLTSVDVSKFDTSKVTDMGYMFGGCNMLSSLALSKFDTSKVMDMSGIFSSCSGLTSLDVSNFNTSKVMDMGYMFFSCSGLTSLDVSNFNTSNVENMNSMFVDCNGLTNLDVSNFNTSNVTDMGSMFADCDGLASLDVSKFDTSNVTDMEVMFAGCDGLASLDVSKFDTSNVTNMWRMFFDCSGLTGLDVSSFDTSNVENMNSMFYDCDGLASLDVSSFDTSNVVDMSNMFYGCRELTSLRLGRQFKMNQTVDLPSISTTEKYTGKWQNIGTGTRENPNGTHIWTSAEFMTNYSGETDADTYVWQPVVKAADVTVEYVDEDNNKLVDNVVKTGNVGESYTTEQKDIPG